MKLGVFTALFGQMTLEKTAEFVSEAGVQAVELGTGNYPGDAHVGLDEALKDGAKRQALLDTLSRYNLQISALSCHGNALHPDKSFANNCAETLKKTIRLAEKLGVQNVIDFSGCPGDGPRATAPNWVTCPWPPDFVKVLEWQWNEKVIPFWEKAGKFATDHGVRIGLELHPGFVVYNTETLLKLRSAVGEVIGANFDPSHLFWQGIDPCESVRALDKAVFHVHAKDTKIDSINTRVNGVLDTKHYSQESKRSWIFRSVGYGHSVGFWKDLVSNLRLVGYDGVLSIEHEDSLMSPKEGFLKAVKTLQEALIFEETSGMWWA